MKIRLPQHFKERKRLRDADGHYRNGITGWFIAFKRMAFQGKERDVALTYTIDRNEIDLITVHPLKEGPKNQRIQVGRWIPYEPSSLL